MIFRIAQNLNRGDDKKWIARQIESNEDIKNQGNVEAIEEDKTQPIPTMPNPNPIMSNSPTVSPYLKDCTVHIPHTNVKTYAVDVLPNHVGDKELNLIKGADFLLREKNSVPFFTPPQTQPMIVLVTTQQLTRIECFLCMFTLSGLGAEVSVSLIVAIPIWYHVQAYHLGRFIGTNFDDGDAAKIATCAVEQEKPYVFQEVADLGEWVVEKIKFIKENVPEEEKAEDSLKRRNADQSVIVAFLSYGNRAPTLHDAELERHVVSVNVTVWGRMSSNHMCSGGDDSQVLIQELHVLVGSNGIRIDYFDAKLSYHILLATNDDGYYQSFLEDNMFDIHELLGVVDQKGKSINEEGSSGHMYDAWF
uniref:Protein transparent testa glabra 1 n=1 Tax=Tanacetum cinerariifolium TaxID=118510 RepID=A0A6L2LUG4_TANCI|nr:protein transparent testa glabra 1 [Tanacetum cinerariifolium]